METVPASSRPCRLRRFVFAGAYTEVRESFESPWPLLARVEELWRHHQESRPDLGMTVHVHNASEEEIHLGISQSGWLLILRGADGMRVIQSAADAEGFVPFAFPEWTEVRRSWLLDPQQARRLLLDWLEGADLPADDDRCQSE
jgi:hypothetical protein